MFNSIIDTFVLSGNSILSGGCSLFETTCLGYSSSTLANDFHNDSVGTSTTLVTTSVSLATICGCSSEGVQRDVKDISMIVESMSLDELYNLRDLVDEKGNSYKLHM